MTTICDQCETVAHCMTHGCIPVQQATRKPTAEDFEVFCDMSYYDMWCLKPKAVRDINLTLHFNTQKEAVHAMHVVLEWFK